MVVGVEVASGRGEGEVVQRSGVIRLGGHARHAPRGVAEELLGGQVHHSEAVVRSRMALETCGVGRGEWTAEGVRGVHMGRRLGSEQKYKNKKDKKGTHV